MLLKPTYASDSLKVISRNVAAGQMSLYQYTANAGTQKQESSQLINDYPEEIV